MSLSLEREIARFRKRKEAEKQMAAARAAGLRIMGADLAELAEASDHALLRARILRRLRRERIRALRRHPDYDLEHHIQLKRVLDAMTKWRSGSAGGPPV